MTRGENLYNIFNHFSSAEKAVFVKDFSHKKCSLSLLQTAKPLEQGGQDGRVPGLFYSPFLNFSLFTFHFSLIIRIFAN